MNNKINLISNPFKDDDYVSQLNDDGCIKFHKSLPGYSHTPLIELDKYSEILNIDFSKKENNLNFWFISKNKEEPRLANRFLEKGSELEQPLAIARDIKKLYENCLLYTSPSPRD